jgi:hypothetical protein
MRKRILVEPETHKEFMSFTVENGKTQDSGLTYLLRQNKLLKKLNKELHEKIRFTIN